MKGEELNPTKSSSNTEYVQEVDETFPRDFESAKEWNPLHALTTTTNV